MRMDDEATPRFMSHFGKLPEYHSDAEGIAAYVEQVELFFAANDVADNYEICWLRTNPVLSLWMNCLLH